MDDAARRTIDLRACQTLAISLQDAAARRASLHAIADRYGLRLSVLDSVRCTPGWIGCGLGHMAALRAWDVQSPLLVLEDDVAVEAPFEPLIEVPADADAVYVGVSLFGGVESFGFDGIDNTLALEPAGPGLFRAHNMLSAHAIVHISRRWREAALEVITDCLCARGWAHDRGLASIQSDFNVYAVERPIFYQAADLQGEGNQAFQERTTRAVLTAPPVGSTLAFTLGGRDYHIGLVRDGHRLAWRNI